MLSRRLGVAVAVLDGHLYAVGGSDGSAPLNTVERCVLCKLYTLTGAVCELLTCPVACRCVRVHIGNVSQYTELPVWVLYVHGYMAVQDL